MSTPKMRGLSLCSGIGGLDLAAEATGLIEIIGQVEIDAFCLRVLAHHWPHAKRLQDIAEVCGDEFGAIEFICAGFPCQPTSHAGQRRGVDDARWLWPHVFRIIGHARPTWILLENVSGLVSLGLDTVLDDLECAGYEAQTVVYPAEAVGAPHQRERVFIIGHHRSFQPVANTHGMGTRRADRDVGSTAPAGTRRAAQRERVWHAPEHCGTEMANTHGQRQQQPIPAISESGQRFGHRGQDVEHARGPRSQKQHPATLTGKARHTAGRFDQRWRQREIKPGVGVSAHGISRWLVGRARLGADRGWPAGPGQAQHAWEAPRTLPASAKIDERAAKLKALGNAVVPLQAFPAMQAIAETWLAEQIEAGAEAIEHDETPAEIEVSA